MVGFEKALEAVKVIKDQIQYRSQNLLNLVCDHVRIKKKYAPRSSEFLEAQVRLSQAFLSFRISYKSQ